MIELWHCLSARSFRPLWMLEELGLPCHLHVLPFPPRVRAREFLALNPLGTIPFLRDGDACMTESAAMCQYLAARHSPRGLDVAPDEPGYADYLNCLHFGEATLTFPQTLILRYRHFEPVDKRQHQVPDDYARWCLARLKGLEPRLQGQDWLCAGRFTAADVSVGYALLLARHVGLEGQFPPGVAAYWERLQARPGYQAAQRRQWEAAAQQGIEPVAAPDFRP